MAAGPFALAILPFLVSQSTTGTLLGDPSGAPSLASQALGPRKLGPKSIFWDLHPGLREHSEGTHGELKEIYRIKREGQQSF